MPLFESDTLIYTGFWTNWTRGRILGATLTLSQDNGAVLIVLLSLFVQLAGSHLWNLICFLVFLARSTSDPQHVLHHQQQALLRTKASSLSLTWQFISTAWRWRREFGENKILRSSLLLLLLGLVHGAGFILASIFSSSVASVATAEVLLKPTSCGQIPVPQDMDSLSDREASTPMNRYLRNMKGSSAYVSSCDWKSWIDDSSEDCKPIGRTRIRWNITTAPCPFAAQMCISDTIRLTSEIADSHLHLGINSPPQDRIGYQRALDCAVIATDGFAYPFNSTRQRPLPDAFPVTSEGVGYFYGQNTKSSESWTYFYNPAELYYPRSDHQGDWSDVVRNYDIDFVFHNSRPENNSTAAWGLFEPLPQLAVSDAITSLIFLKTFVAYAGPVNDPWFSVPSLTIENSTVASSVDAPSVIYVMNQPSVLGCTERWKWCNQAESDHTRCTDFSSRVKYDPQHSAVQGLGLNARQLKVFERMMDAVVMSDLNMLVQAVGAAGLNASNTVLTKPDPLPSDQWIWEVGNWFSTSMAAVQLNTIQYVMGDKHEKHTLEAQLTLTPEEKWMCSNQIVIRSDFQSFSLFGMCSILIIGGLMIILGLSVEPLLTQKSLLVKHSRRLAWVSQGVLQLQRLVFESRGFRAKWQGVLGNTPVSIASEKIARSIILESYALESGEQGQKAVKETVADDIVISTSQRIIGGKQVLVQVQRLRLE